MASLQHLHHIGYAVPSIEAYRAPFPVRHAGPIVDAPHWGRVQLLYTEGGCIELVENGHRGLDHVCFVVDDIVAAIDELRAAGHLLVRLPAPAPAFDGRRVAFLMTPEHSIMELLET